MCVYSTNFKSILRFWTCWVILIDEPMIKLWARREDNVVLWYKQFVKYSKSRGTSFYLIDPPPLKTTIYISMSTLFLKKNKKWSLSITMYVWFLFFIFPKEKNEIVITSKMFVKGIENLNSLLVGWLSKFKIIYYQLITLYIRSIIKSPLGL